MQLKGEDLAMLDLTQRFLREGTFTLKGVDVSKFLEARIWLKQFTEKAAEETLKKVEVPQAEPIAKPIGKPLRKKK